MQPADWNDLHSFLHIARAGHLPAAARAMGVDATTLGRRLRRLERRLGHTLFEQTREGQVPTAAGERLLAAVELMQRAASRIEDNRAGEHQLSGVLRVTMSEGLGTWIVARHLHEFVDRHPALTVDLAANSGFLNLSRREADLAVMLGRPAAGPVVGSKLADYRLRLYAARSLGERVGLPATVGDLARHRLIGYVPDLLYAPELGYLDEIGPRLAASVRSSSINAQHRLIAAGTGIGVLPCFIGDGDPALVPVLAARFIERAFWVVAHKDTRQLQRVRAFRIWLADLVHRRRGELMGA